MKKAKEPRLLILWKRTLRPTLEATAFGISNILHGRRFVKAINEAPIVMVAACNETISADQEWFRVAPLGEHRNEVGIQIVDAESGRAMVSAFNSLLGKMGRLWRGLPITVGHPSDPKWRKDNPEIYAKYPHPVGRVVAMELRGDEAWFKAAFNETGKALISGEGAAIAGHSPGWGMLPIPARGPKVFRPVLLDHIGLTNFPNIVGNTIGLNEAEQQTNQLETNIMPPWLLKLLGFKAEANPTESEVQAAVQTALNERSTALARVTELETKLTTATNEKTTAETQRKAERTARAGVVVTTAINEGRITEASRQTWIDSLVAAADFDVEAAKLTTLSKAVNTQSQVRDLGGRRDEGRTEGTLSAINEAVRTYAKEHGLDYDSSEGYHAAHMGAKEKNPALFGVKTA